MAEKAPIRLSKAARELNVGISTLVDFLAEKGIEVDARPNTKIDSEAYQLLQNEYAPDMAKKQKSEELSQNKVVRETISLENQTEEKQSKKADQDEILIKNVGAFEEQPKAKSVDPEPKKIVEEKETAKEPAKSAIIRNQIASNGAKTRWNRAKHSSRR